MSTLRVLRFACGTVRIWGYKMQYYPAMKASMGDWNYYIVRMSMRDLKNDVQLASAIWKDKTLNEAVQRIIDESRVKQQIVNFLSRRDDRFFSSLVVAAIGGEPDWQPINSQSRIADCFGELSFAKDPKYYALDGQHRLRAIQELLEDPTGAPPGFATEQLSVIVVVREHQKMDGRLIGDEVWLRRYRRLFSSLNRYARPTDADTNIIMDEDDVFAIVTRRMITDYEFFRSPHPERASTRILTKGKNVRSGGSHFTSLQTLYEMNKILLMTTDRRRRWGRAKDLKLFLQFRPEEHEIEAYYRVACSLWDALLEAIPVLQESPERMRLHSLSERSLDEYQDHMLFWPIGQLLLSDVARSALDGVGLADEAELSDMTAVLRPLARVPWELHRGPWRYLLLIPSSSDEKSWRIRNEDRKAALELASRLLRWIIGLDPLDDDGLLSLRRDWQALLYPEPSEDAQIEEMWQEAVSARQDIVVE